MESINLHRRQLLASMGTLAATTLIAPSTASASATPTFYVSATGHDDSDGTTPESPWASIQRVSAQIASGSTVLFHRGETFFGELTLPANCEVGAYGSGTKPTLTLFKLLNRPEGWTQQSAGIWRIDLSRPETHDGYTSTADANVGFLLVNGAVKAARKLHLPDIEAPWDFWCDPNTGSLHVAASDNPTQLAKDIRAAPRGRDGRIIDCSGGQNHIHDLHLTGSGGHGITGSGVDVRIHDCSIDTIGGSYLPDYGDGNVRYGNGIENSPGAKRWVVEDNEISQTYDVAYTSQGNTYDSDSTWEDLIIRNNHIHECTQSFEFWSRGTNPAAGFKGIVVEGNRCERAGYSDFAPYRPNQDVRVHLLTYNWQLPADIVVRNNVFDGAFAAYSYFESQITGLVTKDNTIRLKPGTKLQFQRAETVEQASQWQAATGYEAGSTIAVE